MALSPQYVIDGLVKRGIPRTAAIGFAGNFRVESGLDPAINEVAPLVKGSRGGFGLAQWTGPRRRQLEAFARSQGRDVADPETQMDFLAWELQNTEAKAAQSIFAANDPTEAARLVSERFLRPGIPHLDRRLREAQAIAGGTGADMMAGGAGSDTMLGGDAMAGEAEPYLRDMIALPESTLAQDYASTGALDAGADDGFPSLLDMIDLGVVQEPAEEAGSGAMRGLGLGARSVAQGAAGTVGLAYDPIAATMNALFGTNIAPLRDQVSRALTELGVPEPETATERVLNAMQEGATGALTSAGIGGVVAKAPGVTGQVGRALAAEPVSQVTGGLGAGAGAQGAAEADMGPAWQLAAGLAGGVVGGAIPGAVTGGLRPRMAPDARETVAAAEAAGVQPMTTDVFKPETFIGRSAQRIGEIVPIAGTGGTRAAQQNARVAAVRDLAKTFGADADAADDVMKALLAKRGDDLARYATAKNDVITSIPGAVPVPKTVQAIDDQIAKLTSLKTAEVAPVVAKLNDWKKAIQGQELGNIELLRKQFGEAFTAPELASVRSTGEKALSRIYAAIRDDMGDHIKANGQPRDYTKWRVANQRLSEMMGELDNASLKTALAKGEVTPERIRSLLFSNKPSDVKTLYKNLPPVGRARARAAVLQEALEKATSGDDLSPQKFRSQLVKLGNQIGVFFSGDDLKAVDGMRRVLDMTSRSGEAAASGPTGVQTLPVIGGMAITDMAGSLGSGILSAGAIGLTARGIESKAVRNMLMSIAKTQPGSKDEAAILKRIMEATRAAKSTEEPNK